MHQRRFIFTTNSTRSTAALNAEALMDTSDVPSALAHMPKHFSDMEFSSNVYELERHGRGESHHSPQPPGLIVYCKTTDDVQQIVQYCYQRNIPMIPFGGGTSVEGHVQSMKPHTLSIDLAKYMNRIHHIPNIAESDSPPDAYAVVDAGVSRAQLEQALRPTGFFFSVDPGAKEATIGGMVSTGASGTTTVRHGTMKDNLLEATAVLASEPDAPVIQVGSKALKISAGYDLLNLLCGSEGTLGIVTQVTVKLHPVPQHLVAVTCNFQTLHEAASAVATLLLYGVDLERCELLDVSSVKAFCAIAADDQKDLPRLPTLFLELSAGTEAALQEQVKLVQEILEVPETDEDSDTSSSTGVLNFQTAYGEQERSELWKARHGLYYAAIHSRHGSEGAVVTDAAVPLSHLADLIEATAQDVEEQGVVGLSCGHAGDGNFHCLMPIRKDDSEEYWNKVKLVNTNLIKRTLAVGGTCTGEHGIGMSKKDFLKQQYTSATIDAMKLIKRAMDPKNLLNPGKVIDVDTKA